jgi:hypothetical protein
MTNSKNNTNGHFDISRVPASISYAEFKQRFFDNEEPVIIEGIAADWPATSQWSAESIYNKLQQESSAKARHQWYEISRHAFPGEFNTPEVVEKTIDSDDVFPRDKHIRIFIHDKENMTHWHYDGGMSTVFNTQVSGEKEWLIVSPQTPLTCYPFSNFGIIDDDLQRLLKNKRHSRFILKPGDLLFLPHLWFHRVSSLSDDNLSLGWMFAKKQTDIPSKTLARDLKRYLTQLYFTNHPWQIISSLAHKIYRAGPDYIRVKWTYDEMIKTPYKPIGFWGASLWVFNELLLIPKTLLTYKKMNAYIKSIKKTKAL